MTVSRLTTYAVFALGALMIVVGLIFVSNGMQIVRMELGPAEIAGGSIAASAGCIVIAIGALLALVDGLRGDIERAAVPRVAQAPAERLLRPSFTEPVPAPPPLHPLAPSIRQEPPATEVRPEPALTAALHPEDRVEVETPPPAPQAPEPVLADNAPALMHAEDVAAEHGPTVTAPDRVSDPIVDTSAARNGKPGFLSSFMQRRPLPPFQPGVASASAPAAPAGIEVGSRLASLDPAAGWDAELREDGPLSVSGREPVAYPTHVDVEMPEPHIPFEDERPVVPEPVLDPVEPPALLEAAPPAHGAEPEAEPEPDPLKPVVVGRYNAGAASYVMYSNGMIEVETEQGTHQFASMQELKAFIEKRELRVP